MIPGYCHRATRVRDGLRGSAAKHAPLFGFTVRFDLTRSCYRATPITNRPLSPVRHGLGITPRPRRSRAISATTVRLWRHPCELDRTLGYQNNDAGRIAMADGTSFGPTISGCITPLGTVPQDEEGVLASICEDKGRYVKRDTDQGKVAGGCTSM
jgi:hypothetical protein